MADIEIDITSAQQEQPDIDVHPIYGLKGATGATGATGNGISSITKTSTDGLVDTYTVTYTNGTTTTFTVANGNGVQSIEKTSTDGLVDTYTITFDNGNETTYTVTNGAKGDTGEQGVSVTGVTLQSTVGLDKTYRMTFSDNTYFDFVVSDGAAGSTEWGGISGVLSNQTDLQSALNGKYDSSNPNGYTSNIGTITGITMNGTSKGTSGVVDLGTVITSHQDISGKADKSVETTQNIETLSSGTITLDKTKSIYYRQPAANTTFTFNLASETVTASQSFTFELYVYMPTTVYSLIFPNTLTWQGGIAPNVTEVGLYRFAFQTLDAGTTWDGNLQGVW